MLIKMPTYYDDDIESQLFTPYHRSRASMVVLTIVYCMIYLITFTVFLPISYYIYDEYWIQNHIQCN